MTDIASSVRLKIGTKIYLYASLTIIAAIVLIPLLTTMLGGFKSLGISGSIPSACHPSGISRTIPASCSATATGGR